ncbi:MAG: hypothetical protein VKP62_16625 [Candidatus Sericytochromatia bacterium]|nr:hypothetical protein [Candidatus Sericytochromatia bacterium]
MFDGLLPLSILFAPFVLAGMAVAAMNLFARAPEERGGGTPRADAAPTEPAGPVRVTLTPQRYVGGHPDAAGPLPQPWMEVREDGLTLWGGARRQRVWSIPWASVEEIKALSAHEMQAAAASIRGLQAGALAADDETGAYLRIRHIDARGWWQHTVLELDPSCAADQQNAVREGWDDWRRRQDGTDSGSAS